MRGRRPSPLDDSGARLTATRLAKRGEPILGASAPRGSGVAPVPLARRACDIFALPHGHADVAELVDAHGSGPCLGDQVEVRVLSSASPVAQGCREFVCWPTVRRHRSRWIAAWRAVEHARGELLSTRVVKRPMALVAPLSGGPIPHAR